MKKITSPATISAIKAYKKAKKAEKEAKAAVEAAKAIIVADLGDETEAEVSINGLLVTVTHKTDVKHIVVPEKVKKAFPDTWLQKFGETKEVPKLIVK